MVLPNISWNILSSSDISHLICDLSTGLELSEKRKTRRVTVSLLLFLDVLETCVCCFACCFSSDCREFFQRVLHFLPSPTDSSTLFHSSQKPTRKLAARTFIQSQYLKALAASLRVGVCDEWKRDFRCALCCAVATRDVLVRLRFAHILVACSQLQEMLISIFFLHLQNKLFM